MSPNGGKSVQKHLAEFAADVARRERVIAATVPLHQLARTGHVVPFDKLDHLQIGLSAIRLVVDAAGGGFDSDGLTREELAERIAELMDLQFKVLRDTGQIAKLPKSGDTYRRAEEAVKLLLNTDAVAAHHHAIFDGTSFRSFEFHLMEEHEAADGSWRLQPTPEAINLYFQATEMDISDRVISQQAVLRHYMEQGRFAEAERNAADRARDVRFFVSQINELIRRMDISVRQISFLQDLLPLIEDARDKVEIMMRAEVQLRDAIEHHDASVADDKAAAALDRIRDHIDRNIGLYGRLQARIMASLRTYNERLGEAGFRYRIVQNLPDLDADVLRPMLRLPASVAVSRELVTGLADSFLAPALLPIMDLGVFLDSCMAPRKPKLDSLPEEESVDLIEVSGLDPAIRPEEETQAREFLIDRLAGKRRVLHLSELLALAERGSDADDGILTALILTVLQQFKDTGLVGEHQNTRWLSVQLAGRRFEHCLAKGDDLIVAYLE